MMVLNDAIQRAQGFSDRMVKLRLRCCVGGFEEVLSQITASTKKKPREGGDDPLVGVPPALYDGQKMHQFFRP